MSRRSVTWGRVGTAMFLVGLVLLYRSFLEQGHDWGDDFSLYINQARGLVRGDVPQVVADTRYILQNSGTDSFSPYVYPWGLPILLAPVYLLAGIDYRAFAWVTVGSLVVFIWGFHRLVAPRLGRAGALAVVSVVALSTSYVWWSSSITSDFPAIASVVVALLFIERCRSAGHFAAASRAHLVMVGLLVTWAFSIRREVVVLIVATAVVHAWETRARRSAGGPRGIVPEGKSWVDVTAPYWSFALSAGAFHLVLPASLEQQAEGGGPGRIVENLTWYRNIFAEHVGLKDIGPTEIALFGNEGLGRWMMAFVVGFAVVGIVVAATRRDGRDLAPVTYVLAVSWIILTQPFHEGRYIFGLTPFILWFAFTGAAFVVGGFGSAPGTLGRWAARLAAPLPWLLVVPLAVSNLGGFRHSWDYHREYDYVIHGPENPTAREMFDAVVRCTRGDDVVLFARARAMNLYTNRRAIQTGDVNLGLQRADWMVLTNDDVDYYEPKVNESNYASYGLRKIWANAEFTMYAVGPAPVGRPEACPPIG